jgi:hypothetical protein
MIDGEQWAWRPQPGPQSSLVSAKRQPQPPGEALSPKHEAFVQAYVTNGMNGTRAYRLAYPGCKRDEAARTAAARLLANVSNLSGQHGDGP